MMSDDPDERPCLHCLILDLFDEFYEEYGSPSGEADVIDVSEITTALAKVVAEVTSGSDAANAQQIVDDLARQISKYDAEYRESAETREPGLHVRH
jgi:hypothetical protein